MLLGEKIRKLRAAKSWSSGELAQKAGVSRAYLWQLEGADAQHQVRDVTLEQVNVLGQALKADSPNLKVGLQVEGLRLVP